MKKHLIVLLILLSSFKVSLASDFFLRLYNNNPFSIIFNQSATSYGCRLFQMNNLAPGNYPIEVYSQTVVNTPLAIPIYRGEISIPASYQMMAMIDAYNRIQNTSLIPLYSTQANNGQSFRYNRPMIDLNDSVGMVEAKKILEEISNTRYQLNFLKHSIYLHGIRSERVYELMQGFAFDTDRIDLARYAYGFTIDKENYYRVFDALTFEGSKKQLDQQLYTISSMWRY